MNFHTVMGNKEADNWAKARELIQHKIEQIQALTGAEVTPSPFSMANAKPLRKTRNPLRKALLGLSPEF